MTNQGKGASVLTLNTLAFTACFAVWMMSGVLVTFLVENKVFTFDKVQIGWLMGIPILTGSILRLPVGLATDRFGGKIAGTGFAVGIAYTSVWFEKKNQGTALIAMGIGKAAVYKYIPDSFPDDVGVVGGLGGFVCPIVFGYLLAKTGLWTSCRMIFFALSAICLVWLHAVVRRMEHARAPHPAHAHAVGGH